MSYVRSQVIFPFFTGIPRDVMTNTMHWEWDDVTLDRAEVADEIQSRLLTFYAACYEYSGISNYIIQSMATVECFYYVDAPPRIPEVRPFNPGITSFASSLPTEVAVVMSYHAAPASGVIRQRLHNRIYLGGWPQAVMAAGSPTAFPTIHPEVRTDIADAALGLLNSNGFGLSWMQYSSSPPITTLREIAGGWVDNSPDTQRRRSVDASSRTSWAAA